MIEAILGDKIRDLKSILMNTGFSQSEADQFIPAAAKEFLKTFQQHGQKIDIHQMQQAAETLLKAFNIEGLAAKVGISTTQVQAGITAIMPRLIELAEEHKGTLQAFSSLLGDKQNSPLGSMLSGLGGKFFGR